MRDADTVVIGSGAGGLAAAVALAQAGERVIVLEQHEVPGGWCHSFHEGGFRFSPGVHYIGGLGPGGPSRKVYEGLGVASDLVFFELDPDGYEHCEVHGGDGVTRFDFPKGKVRLAAALGERFRADAAGIRAYLDLVQDVSLELTELSDVSGLWEFLTVPYRTRHLGRYGLYSLERILADRVSDPMARTLLAMQCGDHGLPPSKVPFAVHGAVAGHYLDGGWYPRGGGGALAKAFVRALQRAGGRIMLATSAERILIEGRGRHRRAIGVRLEGGRELRARRVVSNADPHMTYLRLVGAEHLSHRLQRKLAHTRYSLSSISLFFAVDTDLRAAGLTSGNRWYAAVPDAEAIYTQMTRPDVLEHDELPGLFLTATTLKDPTSFDGRHHVCEAFFFVPSETFAAWDASRHAARPDDYVAFKRRLTQTMLATVERLVPGLSRHVVFSSLGTPLTNRHYIRATGGSVYGTEKVLRQMGPLGFPVRTEIDGLYACGASTLSHGVMGATYSGLAAAATALHCRTTELLRDHGVQLRTYNAEDPASWPDWVHDKIRIRHNRRTAVAAV